MHMETQVASEQQMLESRAELQHLMASNRVDPSAEREKRIRDLRITDNLYGSPMPAQLGSTSVTLPYTQEMPTCSLVDVTPEIIHSAFHDRGCLYIPGALDSAEVDILRDAVENAHNACESENGDAAWHSKPRIGSKDEMIKLYMLRTWARDLGGCLAVDSPRALFRICDMFERHGIRDLVERYLGEPPVFSASKFMLWRVPGGDEASWHQDGRFLGDKIDIRSLNIWTALTDCGAGENAPGMELVLDYPTQYYKSLDDSPMDWILTTEQVNDLYKGKVPIVVPTFKAGDMVMFDHWSLHRTSRLPGQTGVRYAIESWFFSPSVFPVGRFAMIA